MNTFSMQQYAKERINNSRRQADAIRAVESAKKDDPAVISTKLPFFAGAPARLAEAFRRLHLRRAVTQDNI